MYLLSILDEIVEKSKTVLSTNPLIPFSDYEKQLFDNTKSFLQHLKTRKKKRNIDAFLPLPPLNQCRMADFKITIIGAGCAGVLCAYQLAQTGFNVTLIEQRNKDNTCLRYPNISFKEGEKTLKPILGNNVYQEFFHSGGSLDGQSGKLRLTIGRFQDIMLNALKDMSNVKVIFEQPFSFEKPSLYEDTDLLILATGCHTADKFNLQDQLTLKRFPDYNAKGITALYIQANEEPHGYSRVDIDGYDWRRDNKSVYSGHAFTPDIKRVMKQIDDPLLQTHLNTLCLEKGVEYTFSFGNDTPQFFVNPPVKDKPILVAHYEVKPQIALTPVFNMDNKTIIALGDANGTPHPLAAIGTLKFVRNVKHLNDYAMRECRIHHASHIDRHALSALNVDIYENEAMLNIEEVFFANIFSSLYSRPRLGR